MENGRSPINIPITTFQNRLPYIKQPNAPVPVAVVFPLLLLLLLLSDCCDEFPAGADGNFGWRETETPVFGPEGGGAVCAGG